MKIHNLHLILLLPGLSFATLLYSQPASLCDKELLYAFLQEQRERDEQLYTLLTKVLQSLKNGNITIDIKNNLNNSNTTTASTDVKAETKSSSFQNICKDSQEKLLSAYTSAQNSIAANKIKYTAGALLAAYICLNAYLSYQYYIVYTQYGWASWCNHLELSELVCSNNSDLTQKLLKDIHKAYLNKDNVHDVITPHTQFIHEINLQIDAASSYVYFYDALNSLYLGRIFGLRQTNYIAMKEAHTRLSFIKNLFITWLNQKT